MGRFSSVCVVVLFIGFVSGASVQKDIKEVEEFISGEIEKPHVSVKRSDVEFIPAISNFEETLPSQNDEGVVTEPSAKPDKISVTIYKEYKAQDSDGNTEYVSIQDQGGDLKGSLSPPAVQEFIQEQLKGSGEHVRPQDIDIQKATDFEFDTVRNSYVPDQQPRQINQQQQQQQRQPEQSQQKPHGVELIEQITSSIPVPTNYRRKTMDGWIPLFGKSFIGPGKTSSETTSFKNAGAKSHYTKGIYYSSAKKDAILGSASGVVPQVSLPDGVGEIIQVQPEMEYFSKGDVINKGEQTSETKVQNQVADKSNSGSQQSQKGNSQMVIHAQNVIFKSNNQDDKQATPQSLRQLQAYDSTPQISALLRERFRMNLAQQMNGKQFPHGGMPLRSLAQAIRNGAFSIENDIIPSSASEKPQELEINIPHKFKMRPLIQTGYANINLQGIQATSASIDQPISQSFGRGGSQGNPPKINANSFATGLRDYGEGVKYALRGEPVEIVETQPAGGFDNGGQSLNQLAQELENKLRQLVQQEVLMASMLSQQQYAAPTQSSGVQQQPQQEYGAPQIAASGGGGGQPQDSYGPPQSAPQNSYGPPSGPQGAPLDSYGPPQQEYGPPGQQSGEPLTAYGPPGGGDGGYPNSDHLAPPPEKPSKPYSLALDFDSGFWGNPHASVDIEGGDIADHGHGGWGSPPPASHGHDHDHHHDHDEGPDIKEEVKEHLVHLGKNLFYSALDFSRHYNPITFIEHVKKFPPVKFEIHDRPKKSHHHKGKGKGKHRH